MRIGAAAALGRTFWEYLECVQEVGIKYVEIPCDIGYWKPIGALGYTPDNILSLWPAQAMHSFPPEYVEPSTGRPSLEAKEKIESYGITTAGFYVKNDFLYTDPVKRDNEVKKIKELLRIANKWGTVETLRIHGGEATNTNVWQLSLEKCIELIIDGIQKSAKYAQEYGVALALENHYLVLQDPDNLMRIYNEVSSDWFGFNVDTGNFHAYGYRPEKLKETFKLLAPYTKTTHMKL